MLLISLVIVAANVMGLVTHQWLTDDFSFFVGNFSLLVIADNSLTTIPSVLLFGVAIFFNVGVASIILSVVLIISVVLVANNLIVSVSTSILLLSNIPARRLVLANSRIVVGLVAFVVLGHKFIKDGYILFQVI